ncbi:MULTISPECIES: sulfurtransferase [Streptomyces]|uniref:Sulfurtransferase n=1 Tax=Streptomyces griseocarneus TaxID=51201 RepID=A0ABX7RK90_9ACTN|nr:MULTISPECIES: sulfurtransferase [Streptomyces]QSY48587.1 sulfurtransferase [Streptomyces griseocarneus]
MGRNSALVTGEWAESRLGTEGVVFVETGNENTQYLEGHIPGAVWMGWREFQDDPGLGVIGREKFERLLRAKGIGEDDTVVIHSSMSNLFAALVHWYFTLYGHRSVKLLDGGRRKWELDARPLTRDVPHRPPTRYRAAGPDASVRATRDDVIAAIGHRNIVDVRTPEEFTGRIFAPGFAGEAFAPGNNPHELAQRAGHVPGAVNLPWEAAVNADDTFKSDEELAALHAGLDPSLGAITYCWVGARSAHTWFVLRELLDRPDVRNYDGSWAEYGSLIGVPVERGPGGRAPGFLAG